MRLRSDDGSSAVEFAILAPVFLLLVFGMIAYAIYFGTAHYIQQITADAARASIAGLDNDERERIVEHTNSRSEPTRSYLHLATCLNDS
jgi:Flp pilus assembly protein TadG